MDKCKSVNTPIALGVKLTKIADTGENDTEKRPYQELIGALMYVTVGTRPDIAHAVSALSQFKSCHRGEHWAAAKRVLRYLRGTSDIGLTFHKNNQPLRGFADADWGNCAVDRRSYSGYVFTLSGGSVTWESRKQRTVALSSTEAEYMAIANATKEAMYLTNFLKELGCADLADATIYNDNRSAGLLAENPVFYSRSKHIDIKHHFIRQAISERALRLVYLPEEMIADVLTKALSGVKHSRCLSGLGLQLIDHS